MSTKSGKAKNNLPRTSVLSGTPMKKFSLERNSDDISINFKRNSDITLMLLNALSCHSFLDSVFMFLLWKESAHEGEVPPPKLTEQKETFSPSLGASVSPTNPQRLCDTLWSPICSEIVLRQGIYVHLPHLASIPLAKKSVPCYSD